MGGYHIIKPNIKTKTEINLAQLIHNMNMNRLQEKVCEREREKTY